MEKLEKEINELKEICQQRGALIEDCIQKLVIYKLSFDTVEELINKNGVVTKEDFDTLVANNYSEKYAKTLLKYQELTADGLHMERRR